MSDESKDLPERQPLDRGALERVLARAAELQSAEGEGDEPELTDAQLIDIAKEVGLGPVHLRQALAEERTRLAAPVARGAVDHLFGPATAHAMRTVRGNADAQLAALDALMQQEEGLRVKRRYGNRVLWERAPGIVANLTRALDMGGRGYHLARTDEIAATAVIVDDQRTVVTIEASLQRHAVAEHRRGHGAHGVRCAWHRGTVRARRDAGDRGGPARGAWHCGHRGRASASRNPHSRAALSRADAG